MGIFDGLSKKTGDKTKDLGKKTAEFSKDFGKKTAEFSKDLGKKTAEKTKILGQKTAKKTKEISDIVRIKSLIRENEEKLQDIYADIGKFYVENRREAADPDFAGFLNEVAEVEWQQNYYEEKIREIKEGVDPEDDIEFEEDAEVEEAAEEVIVAEAVEETIEEPVEEPVEEPAEAPAEEPVGKVCRICGAAVEGDPIFCPVCGARFR